MCYFNGVKVKYEQFVRLKRLEKLVAKYDFLDTPLFRGPESPMTPILKRAPEVEDFELSMQEWGFLPKGMQDPQKELEFRQAFMTLNAKVENLFVNEQGKASMYAEAAMQRRCLVLSTGFYEWRNVLQRGKSGKVLKQPYKVPYHVKVKGQELYYFAGIYNPSAGRDTYAIVTAPANHIMSRIHNGKLRMPVILTEDLAWEWMFGNLSKDDVQDIGRFQFPSEQMEAYTVAKDFTTAFDPAAPFNYPNNPDLEEEAIFKEEQLGFGF